MTGSNRFDALPDHFPPGVHQARFEPARWLPGKHLQTIWAPLLRTPASLPVERERWELPDGDFLDIDRLRGSLGAPTLLVLHGLEGSSSAGYSRGLLAQAERRGLSGVALNFRSCSGELNRLPRSYHSGETGDLSFAIARLRAEAPGQSILLAGVSLGGNVLVKWLGEQGDSAPPEVRGAVAISVPFDLAASAATIDGPGFWAHVYCRRFLKTLRAKARAKAARFPGSFDARRLDGIRTLTGFDDVVTGPVHGFSGAPDYYAKSSSNQFIARVRTPLLLLSAEDDPFIPVSAIPRSAIAENEAAPGKGVVRLEISPNGGHVGFVSGPLQAPIAWAEERAGQFFDALIARDRA